MSDFIMLTVRFYADLTEQRSQDLSSYSREVADTLAGAGRCKHAHTRTHTRAHADIPVSEYFFFFFFFFCYLLHFLILSSSVQTCISELQVRHSLSLVCYVLLHSHFQLTQTSAAIKPENNQVSVS